MLNVIFVTGVLFYPSFLPSIVARDNVPPGFSISYPKNPFRNCDRGVFAVAHVEIERRNPIVQDDLEFRYHLISQSRDH